MRLYATTPLLPFRYYSSIFKDIIDAKLLLFFFFDIKSRLIVAPVLATVSLSSGTGFSINTSDLESGSLMVIVVIECCGGCVEISVGACSIIMVVAVAGVWVLIDVLEEGHDLEVLGA